MVKKRRKRKKIKYYKKKYPGRYRTRHFIIAIFRNGKEYRKLIKRKYFVSTNRMFEKLLNENDVYFPVRFGSHLKPELFELVIYSNEGSGLKYHPNQDLLKTKLPTLQDDGFVIKKIEPFDIEEKFLRYGYSSKITFKDFVKLILTHQNKTLTVYWFKNKLYFEDFEETVYELFSFKNEYDCKRFMDIFRKFLIENKMYDVLIMGEAKTSPERSEVYEKIKSNLDVTREFLFRPYTH